MRSLLLISCSMSLLLGFPVKAQEIKPYLATERKTHPYPSQEGITELPSLDLLGTWRYDLAKNSLKVSYYGDYYEAISTFSNPYILGYLLDSAYPEITAKTIVEVFSENSCGSFFVDAQSFIDKADIVKIQVPGKIDCRAARSSYVNSFPFALTAAFPQTPASIIAILEAIPLVKEKELLVTSLNSSLFRIFSPHPQKNLVFSGDNPKSNYWEILDVFVSLDRETELMTLIIEAKYATGINRPPRSAFSSSNLDFHEEIKVFSTVLKEQLF